MVKNKKQLMPKQIGIKLSRLRSKQISRKKLRQRFTNPQINRLVYPISSNCVNKCLITPYQTNAHAVILGDTESRLDVQKETEYNCAQSNGSLHDEQLYHLRPIVCRPNPETAKTESELIQWLNRLKPKLLLAPDGFLPNSTIRESILQKPINVMAFKQQIQAHSTSSSEADSEIQHLLESRLMDHLEVGDIFSAMSNLRTQLEAVWREEARVFLKNVMQEEKYRLDKLLSTETEKSTPDAIPYTPAPVQPRMRRPASLVSRNVILAVHNQKAKRSSPVESIFRKEPELVEAKQEKPVECMPQVQFQTVFNQLVSHIGSRAQVYTIISAALGRDPQALGLISNILGNRLVRTSFFKTVRSPTYLFDFLATLLGSRTELRVTLSDIIDGNVDAFDRLACWIDSDTALFNMIQCYKDACREAQMIVQSYLPVSRSSSFIVDMLIDGNRSEESIAELINGVSYDMQKPISEQILQVAPETLRLISTALVSCDYKRLQEMKSAKITFIEQRQKENVIREKAPDSQSPMNEVTQDSSELRALLASNSLVKDTLDELYTNPQTSILEPTVSDYISLVNKGEVLGSQAPGSSRATEYAIEYFCAMTKHLRNVMTWSIVKDPVHHDLCIANFEHTVRHALTVSQMIARHIEGFMGGAAKLKNVPDLLQRAVNGDAEANQELLSLLGQGKGSFLLSSVQQAQGQVVDRILRHCATETQIEEIEAMLRQTQSEDNGETIKRLVDGWMRLFKNASKLAVKLGVSNTIKRTKSLLLTKDFQRLISRLPGELEMKHEPDDIVPMTAAELDVIHQTAISAAAIPAKTKYPALVKRKLLFKRTSSVGRSAMNDRKVETHVQSGKPKSFQKTDVMLPDLVLPDSVESVTDEFGTGKPTNQRGLTSDQLMTTPESGTYLDAVTTPVSRGKTKPVEGSSEMAAKRLTYQPVRLKALKEDTKVSAAKLKPHVLSTPSPTPKAESLTSTQKLEQLRKEERAILNIKRSRGISRLELQKLVNRLQSHQLVPKLPPMLISKISDTDVVEQAHVVMATDEEVTAVLEHVQNAMAALIISELIEQSKTRRSPTDSRKSTNAKTFLSFMRRGSTLMKDTVSSAARKANLTGMEDTLDMLQKESDEKGLLGVVRQSSSSDDLLSWDSSSASSPRGHHQLDRLRKLNEMQQKYTADANLLVAEIAQETLLLNEQEMKVLMFNTFLVENLQKLFARLEAEQEDWTSGSSRSQAARLEEFRQKLSTFLQESTNDLPSETQNKMSSAVNALINELQANLAKLAEYSPTVREQPREDEGPEQGFMSTETFEQLNAALQSMFMNRLKTVAESLTFTGVSIKSDLSELKQAIKTRTEIIQNMVATLQSELLQGVDIPPVVNTIIRRRLSELGREVRRRVKQQAKQLAKERRKTIHRTFRVSLLNVHRTPSSQLSSSSFSSDSRGQEGREITFPDAAAAAAADDDDDDDRKEVKTTVKLEGFYESHEQQLPVGGIQTKVTKLQEKPSYTSTRSQLPVSQDSIRTKSTLAMRKPDMVDMVEYIVNQLEQYTDYNSNELELIRQIFHMMSQSDQPVPKPEQVDFMRERYIEITEEHPRLYPSLLTKLQNVGKTTSSRHSSRAESLFADDPEGVKMKVFMNSLRNSLKSQSTDPSTLEAQINLLEQSVTNIMENLELYSFPKLRMDNAVMTGSQDITADSYLRKQKCRSPEGWAISLPLIGSDSTAHRTTRLGGSQVTRSSKLKFKDSIMGISIEGINIGVRKLTDFSWKTKVPEPALASKLSSFVGVVHDGEESIEVSGVGQEQDDHLSTESHPERKDLESSTGSSLTYSLPLHTELLADVKGEQPDEVTTTITTIPSSESERFSDGHSANTPTTVRSKHIPKRSTVLTPVDVKGEQPDEVTTTITTIQSSESERFSDGHSAKTPTTVRSKHIPKRSTVLTPVLNVPRNSRVMSRPSWIPCRDWSRLVGPIAHPVVIYKTNEKIEAHFRRAVDLHIFPTTLQTRYDLGDIFKRATILSKNRLRLPPIGPYA